MKTIVISICVSSLYMYIWTFVYSMCILCCLGWWSKCYSQGSKNQWCYITDEKTNSNHTVDHRQGQEGCNLKINHHTQYFMTQIRTWSWRNVCFNKCQGPSCINACGRFSRRCVQSLLECPPLSEVTPWVYTLFIINHHCFWKSHLIWLYFYVKSNQIWFNLELFVKVGDLVWLYFNNKSYQKILFDLKKNHHDLTQIICNLREVQKK